MKQRVILFLPQSSLYVNVKLHYSISSMTMGLICSYSRNLIDWYNQRMQWCQTLGCLQQSRWAKDEAGCSPSGPRLTSFGSLINHSYCIVEEDQQLQTQPHCESNKKKKHYFYHKHQCFFLELWSNFIRTFICFRVDEDSCKVFWKEHLDRFHPYVVILFVWCTKCYAAFTPGIWRAFIYAC